MSTAIQQINAILGQLTPAQRAAVEKYVDLSKVNIMTLSEKDAVVLLTRLKAAVGTVSNPIANNMSKRAEELAQRAGDSYSVMDEAKQAYYDAKKAIPSESDENYETARADAETAFRTYMTKADIYSWDKKRANGARFYADLAQRNSGGFDLRG